MADPRKLTAFQVFISKLFGISSIGVKMLSLICYQYILVVIFLLATSSSRVTCGSCRWVCDGQFNKCLNSRSKDPNQCINDKFKCFEKCQTGNRVKKDTEHVRDQAVIFYYLQHLCANHCKITYDRINSVCTKNCLENIFNGRLQKKTLKLWGVLYRAIYSFEDLYLSHGNIFYQNVNWFNRFGITWCICKCKHICFI